MLLQSQNGVVEGWNERKAKVLVKLSPLFSIAVVSGVILIVIRQGNQGGQLSRHAQQNIKYFIKLASPYQYLVMCTFV